MLQYRCHIFHSIQKQIHMKNVHANTTQPVSDSKICHSKSNTANLTHNFIDRTQPQRILHCKCHCIIICSCSNMKTTTTTKSVYKNPYIHNFKSAFLYKHRCYLRWIENVFKYYKTKERKICWEYFDEHTFLRALSFSLALALFLYSSFKLWLFLFLLLLVLARIPIHFNGKNIHIFLP